MGIFNSLLGSTPGCDSWAGIIENANADWTGWLGQLMNTLSIVMWVCLALVGAAGGIYAIYVGIKMARADSAEQREENKKRLINIIVSIVAVVVLILFFNIFLPMILNAFGIFDTKLGEGGKDGEGGTQSLTTLVNTAKVLMRI